MKSATELRKELPGVLTQDFGWECPNSIAIKNSNSVLDAMEKYQLDATTVVQTAEIGIAFVWLSVLAPERYAHIECTNDGAVTGTRSNRNVDFNHPDFCKVWWISELTKQTGTPGVDCPGSGDLILSLEETIEHIRCFIWADYNQ